MNFTVPDSSTATVDETQQSGYQLVQQHGSNAVCTSGGNPIPSTNVGTAGFSVPIGSRQILSCTVVNSLIPATLTLTKTVDNPFGGNADPIDWTLQAAGPQTISGPSGSTAVTGAKVAPGTYTLSELDGPDGYTPSTWSCTGASVSGSSVTVVADATVSCGITNTEFGVPVLTQDKTVNAATAHVGNTLTYTMSVGNTGTADAAGVTASETLPAGVTFASAGAIDRNVRFGERGVDRRDRPRRHHRDLDRDGHRRCRHRKLDRHRSLRGESAARRRTARGRESVPGRCGAIVRRHRHPAESRCARTRAIQDRGRDDCSARRHPHLRHGGGEQRDGGCHERRRHRHPAVGCHLRRCGHSWRGTYDSTTGLWSVGTVASGTSATLTITATVNAGTEATTQTNRFLVTSTGIPVVVLDACTDAPTESCATTTVPGVPRLVQNKVVDQTSAPVGSTLTYTMTLANTGTGDATGVVAHDTLPAGITIVSADTNGSGTFDTTTGDWNIGTIAVSATATLTVTATIEPQAAGSTLVNAFQVVEPPDAPPPVVDNPCPSPDEESSCATTTVPGIPELTQSKVVGAQDAAIGQTLTYSMAVGNSGSADASGVTAQDLLPAGVTFVSADTAGVGTYSPTSGVWSIGTVPQGALYTLTITATVNQGTDDTTQINRFGVNAPAGEPTPIVEQPCADNLSQSSATTWIPGTPQLVVGKTVNSKSAAIGANLTYSITVANTGAGNATDVLVQELPPSGLTLTSANTNGSGTFDLVSLLWTVPLVAPGATATLTLVGMVGANAAGTLTNRISVTAPPGAGPTIVTDPCTDSPSQACASTAITMGATVVPIAARHALAATGVDVSGLVSSAVFLVALGALALALSRRRAARRHRRPPAEAKRQRRVKVQRSCIPAGGLTDPARRQGGDRLIRP